MRRVLVTGASGLIGSEVVAHFDARGWAVAGLDNNMRADFFGPEGDTSWNLARLRESCANFSFHDADIRDRETVSRLLRELRPHLVVHAAAQPSHDLAARRPFDDFEVNAVGTLNMLEATRLHSPEAVFVLMSTNKVYGDRPNDLALRETPTRWDYDDPACADGIDETMSIDQSKHSLFGASKAAADLLTQEYGRYFGMATCVLRGGCLTGPSHSGVELHGFLSYLVRCNMEGRDYTVFGYQGKQVRDNIHSHDVACAIEMLHDVRPAGDVFNLGGGRENSISIREAFERVGALTGKQMRWGYRDEPRSGDHICYISDVGKLRRTLPGWDVTVSLDDILEEIVGSWASRMATA